MKNHEKAKEFYEKNDPDKEALETLTRRIHDAPSSCSLNSLMSGIGFSFADEVVSEAICALEAAYEALQKEKEFIEKHKLNLKNESKPASENNIWTNDELFDIAFNKMYRVAQKHNNEDIIKALQEYYPELYEQVQTLGIESSSGVVGDNLGN
jgi:hypothetical protein